MGLILVQSIKALILLNEYQSNEHQLIAYAKITTTLGFFDTHYIVRAMYGPR